MTGFLNDLKSYTQFDQDALAQASEFEDAATAYSDRADLYKIMAGCGQPPIRNKVPPWFAYDHCVTYYAHMAEYERLRMRMVMGVHGFDHINLAFYEREQHRIKHNEEAD